MNSSAGDASSLRLRRHSSSSLLLGAALLAGLLVAGYLGFVRTTVGQRWDNAGYAGRQIVGAGIKTYDSEILSEVSTRSLVLALAGLFLLSHLLRCWRVGIVVVLATAVAVFGAEVIKHALPRATLASPTVPVPATFWSGTYPSGHATIGTSLSLALVIICGGILRPWLAVLAGVTSSSYATAVFFLGWHRPSDALGGIVWSGLCLSTAAAGLVLLEGRRSPRASRTAWQASAALAAVMIGALVLKVASRPGDTTARFSILCFSASMIAAGFALPAWLAFALRHIAWRRETTASETAP
jgi:hypothetical protein